MKTAIESLEIAEASSLAELAETLGFVETSAMRKSKAAVIKLMREGGDCTKDYREYEEGAESQGFLAEPEGQISLMIMKALIFQEAGDNEGFAEEIRDAKTYASNASTSYPERFNTIEEAIRRLTT